MNDMATFRPLKFGELLDGTFRIYKRHFWAVWLFVLMFTFPFTLWIEWWYLQENGVSLDQTAVSAEKAIMIQLLSALIWMAVIHPVIQNACADLSRKERIGWKQLCATSFYNIWKIMLCQWLIVLLWAVIFGAILSTVGLPLYSLANSKGADNLDTALWMAFLLCLFLFLLPGVYLFIRLSLVIPILRTEECSIRQSMKRSWELTRGAFGRAFGILVSLLLFSIPLTIILVGMEGLAAAFYPVPDWLWNFVYLLTAVLVNSLMTPLLPIFFGIFYWNQRAVKEAHDLMSQLHHFKDERR